MLTERQTRDILDRILRLSTAEETEVSIKGGYSVSVRFAQNMIYQNLLGEGYEVSVRPVQGKRTARASTTRLDDASFRELMATVLEITRHMPEDPELLPLLEPQRYPPPSHVLEKPISVQPSTLLSQVDRVITIAESRNLKASGYLSYTYGGPLEDDQMGIFALANSKGLFAYGPQQTALLSVTVEGTNSSGWARQEAFTVEELDPETIAQKAVAKCLQSENPREVLPGKYTVILEPAAVASLLHFLLEGFNAMAYHEGRSFLRDKLGKRIAVEDFTMLDDAYHPLFQGRYFDDEGVIKQRVVLIDKGVASNLLYARREAHRYHQEPTGHGLQVPNPWGAKATNVVVMGGQNKLEDMIRQTERGLLISRFWYNRLVDPMQVIVTGMTRDGTFLIEEGEIRWAVKNLRFNQSLLEMLMNIQALGPSIKIEGMIVPPMKIKDFSFTSTTEF